MPYFHAPVAFGKTHWQSQWHPADGTMVETDPYTSEDLMASVLHSIGISLDTRFTAKNGRPMKIANGGRLIKELFA